MTVSELIAVLTDLVREHHGATEDSTIIAIPQYADGSYGTTKIADVRPLSGARDGEWFVLTEWIET